MTDDYATSEALKEVTNGMAYASLAITDDEPETLVKLAKTNPWQKQALQMLTGADAVAPLTELLEKHYQLKLDCHLNITGLTKGGHILDTQGYIAHNESTIVLSYRCTTSALDWLTNLNTTTSAWQLEYDLAAGDSGFCSGFEGFCCVDEYQPRVHTGFYNNFLASLPQIREHIEPLLMEEGKPRTLYVVGHSLGAGIATLASVYFLLERSAFWETHRLVSVTAGSPRACARSMKDLVHQKLQEQPNVSFYRLVLGKDVVTTVPPGILGFGHVAKAVRITSDGEVVFPHHLIGEVEEKEIDSSTLYELVVRGSPEEDESTTEEVLKKTLSEDELEKREKYQKLIAKVPQSLRDHMPDFYLKPLLDARDKFTASLRGKPSVKPELDDIQETDSETEMSTEPAAVKATLTKTKIVETKEKKPRGLGRFFRRKKTQAVA